jgi:hypothetical protein
MEAIALVHIKATLRSDVDATGVEWGPLEMPQAILTKSLTARGFDVIFCVNGSTLIRAESRRS